MLLGEYSSRVADLEEKLRVEGSLSASEQEEWALLKIHAPVLLDADRNAAIKNSIVIGGNETKQLVWDEIAKAGAAGAAAAVGSKNVKGGSAGQGEREAPTAPKNSADSFDYKAAPYHGKHDNAIKSRAPANGQEALNSSIQVKSTSLRRIGIDYETKEFVVFDNTQDMTYHGHVRAWDDLHPDMQRALQQAGMVDRRGKILTR